MDILNGIWVEGMGERGENRLKKAWVKKRHSKIPGSRPKNWVVENLGRKNYPHLGFFRTKFVYLEMFDMSKFTLRHVELDLKISLEN